MDDLEGTSLVLVAGLVCVAIGLVLWVGYLVVGAVAESMGRDFGSRTGVGLTFLVGGALLGTLVLTLFSPISTALLLGIAIGVALAAAALLFS